MPKGLDGMRYVTSRPGKAGETRWYWQRKGYALTRLPDDEVERHQSAKALNDAADRGEMPQKPVLVDANSLDLVAGIIADYRAHRTYTRLAAGTKKSYEPVLSDLREMWGSKRVAAIDQSLCVDFLESIPKLNERRKTRAVLRCVLKRAVYHRKLPSNPTDGIELESPTARERYLQEPEIVKFIEACRAHETHGRMVYNGFMLLLFTVQRPGDMLKMGRSQYTGGVIRLRQQKTSKWVEVPAHPQLRPLLDGLVEANDALLFMTHEGKPVSEKTFNYRFNEVKRAAGLADIQARDLRRTATIRMAEAGAEIQDIAACGGWSIEYTKKILETYMPRTLKMAERGVARMPNISLTF
jgi:integrase